MERIPCPITGSGEFTPVLQAPDRFNHTLQPWNIVQATASGLHMLNPRPAPGDMAAHYPADGYDPFLNSANARSLREHAYIALSSLLLRKKAAIVMNGIEKQAASVNILETGCASGRLLLALHRHYGIPLPNLFGIEPDPRSIQTARSSGLRNISESEMADAAFKHTFDRIVFWHVLEHLHMIKATLDRTRELLKPDGVLIIALPNIDSYDARRYGPHWIALDAPRHLYHFTPETLEKLLEKHGFSVIDFSRWIPDTLYNVWYSEKLDRTIGKRPFGITGYTSAAGNTVRSLLAGRNPRLASGIICRAVKVGQG